MDNWLEMLIVLSVVGSTSVACFLVLNPISQKRFSANWHYLIRKLTVFLYLVPVVFIVQNLSFLLEEPIAPVGITQTSYWGQLVTDPSISIAVAVGILSIWGIGFVLYGAWQVYCYQLFTKDIRKSTISVPTDSEVYKLLATTKEMMGIKGEVKLAYNSGLASPALVGLLKPMILLPLRKMSASELNMVFRHELIHYKRKDLWVKFFVLVASALHWFNPFVHILRKDVHFWSELACDEAVIKDMSYGDRKQYGVMILNMLEDSLTTPVSYSVLLSGSKKNLERRLIMLIDMKKVKKPVVIIAATIILAIGAIGTTAGALASKNIPDVDSSEAKGAIVDPNYDDKVAYENIPLYSTDNPKEETTNPGFSKLIAVSRSDEKRFSPEAWQEILIDIEKGNIYWEESKEWKKIMKKIEKGDLSWEDLYY